MRIGRKVIFALLASGAVMFIAIGALASRVVLTGHRELEEVQIRCNTQRAADVVRHEIQSVDGKLADWSVWDDAYAYFQDKAPDFERRNITAPGMTGLDVQAMFFFNLDGSLRRAREVVGDAIEPASDSLAKAVARGIDPVRVSGTTHSVQGLLSFEGKIYIVAAAPVVPSDSSAPPSGVLVFLREVDDSLLGRICRLTQLQVSMQTCEATASNPTQEFGDVEIELSKETARGQMILRDINDQPAFALSAATNRNIYRHGVSAVETLLIVLGAGGLIAVTLTWILLRQLIVRRLESITGQMGSLRDGTAVLEECGDDEIGQLVMAINALVLDVRRGAAAIDAEHEKLREVTACVAGTVFRIHLDRDRRIVADFISEGAHPLFQVAEDERRAFFDRVLEHIAIESQAQVAASIVQACEAGTEWKFEFPVMVRDKQRWLRGQAVPFSGASGSSGLSGVLYDITETKEIAILLEKQSIDLRTKADAIEAAREKADTANRAKSEFLANMSHEIRTPMTAILGYADLLVDPSSRSEERADYIATIRRNGEHLLSIINDILDLSKIEANYLVLEAAEVPVSHVVEDVIQSFRPRAQSKGLALESEIRFPLPRTIAGDPLRLRQVLVNLVGNAIKFTETGSVRISLAYDPNAAAVRFEVKDTGIGLSDEQMSRLFQPFSQGDNTMSRKFGGTGLGLAISQRLVRMMGGEIGIKSVPDRGSTFSFSLPAGAIADDQMLHAPSRREAAARAVHPHLDLSGFGARVLLAEDGPDNQRLISFLLRKAGLSVVIAENGRIAIETFERAAAAGDPFNLIFMDMQMPVLDGYSATRELRSKGVRTPIIALTAHAMSSDREKCLKAGCDDYASKPIDRGALLALCEQHLRLNRPARAA